MTKPDKDSTGRERVRERNWQTNFFMNLEEKFSAKYWQIEFSNV